MLKDKRRANRIKDILETKHQLTEKQSKYVEAVAVLGMPKTHALQAAGYAPGTTSPSIESPTVRNALHDALMRAGIGADYLARKVKQGLNAKDYRFFAKDGIVTDERVVPDHAVQEKYLKVASEVSGFIRSDQAAQINIGIVTIPAQGISGAWNDPQAQTASPNEAVSPSEGPADIVSDAQVVEGEDNATE